MKRSKIMIPTALAALIVGGIAGYFLYIPFHQTNAPVPTEVRVDSSQYQFVNPLLYVASSKTLYTAQYKGLVSSLDTYIGSVTSSHQAQDVSIYFRDMNTGHWTGIGEDELYHPSSMLKVLTLMATAQLAENDALSLSDTLRYVPGDPSLQYYEPEDDMAAGTYTLQDLSAAMIIYSDNAAAASLLSDPAINDEFTALYKLFRLPTATSSTEDFMSARSYSTIWRALYNGTLLSDGTSENVLQLLSDTSFKDGLVSGVPAGTTVSHKFGEYSEETPAGNVLDRELHDCGIVYYPKHPYLLCVMTRGTDFPALAHVIAGVSGIVYDFTASSTALGK